MLELVLLSLALGALLVLTVPKRWAPEFGMLAVVGAAAAAVPDLLALARGGTPTGLWNMLRLDAPGALVLMLVLTLGFFAAFVSSETERWPRRFFALLLTFTLTMTLASMADNLGLLWASVEATTLSSALLVGHHRTKESTEAAWKYLILSSTGILFAFIASIVLVLASRGAGDPTLSYAALLQRTSEMDTGLVRLALVLATVGYGTKAGLVPYHFWLPDAHSEAPAPVSALLSGVLLSCALLALDRFTRLARLAGAPMETLHLTLGALSIVVGGTLVFAARTYKRMLAYSSVENMGLVVFAVGLGTPWALVGAYLHVLTHGIAKGLAFFSAGRIHHHVGTVVIADARDTLSRTPAAGRGLLVGLLSLGGLPPFGPFASKLIILGAAFVGAGRPFVPAILFGLTIAFIGFLRHTATLMAPTGAADSPPAPPFREPWTVTTTLTLMTVLSVVLCFAGPTLVHNLLALSPGAVP